MWLRSVTAIFWQILIVLSATGVAQAPLTLRQAAAARHLLVGTAVRPSLFSERAYTETLGREFNMVEPEDALKWSVLRRNAHRFDFHDGDEVVRFASAHGMRVRGHCLVWDHDHPQWLKQGDFSPEQLSRLLQDYISTVMKHYAGRVFAWDVINEALDETGRVRDSIWYNRPGIGLAGKRTAYIEQAFSWAHEADPQALLFYNEAEGEGLNQKSQAAYEMLRDFRQRGVPVEGVGLQMHVSNLEFDRAAVASNIARLTALGLQIHITELDVSLPFDSVGRVRDSDLQRQADIYREVVRICLQNPGCTAIQTWGFSDKYSWIGSHSHGGRGAALLFDRLYRPKPAYEVMVHELAGSVN
jgi:endo-1,4-beta-xylanase